MQRSALDCQRLWNGLSTHSGWARWAWQCWWHQTACGSHAPFVDAPDNGPSSSVPERLKAYPSRISATDDNYPLRERISAALDSTLFSWGFTPPQAALRGVAGKWVESVLYCSGFTDLPTHLVPLVADPGHAAIHLACADLVLEGTIDDGLTYVCLEGALLSELVEELEPPGVALDEVEAMPSGDIDADLALTLRVLKAIWTEGD
jgi:hypothetical protein